MALLTAHFQSRDLRSQLGKSESHAGVLWLSHTPLVSKTSPSELSFLWDRKLHLYLPLKI